MRTSTFFVLSSAFSAHAVTIYTTLTENNGSTNLPTNTNTATGPAYTGYTGTISAICLFVNLVDKLMSSFSLQSNDAYPTCTSEPVAKFEFRSTALRW